MVEHRRVPPRRPPQDLPPSRTPPRIDRQPPQPVIRSTTPQIPEPPPINSPPTPRSTPRRSSRRKFLAVATGGAGALVAAGYHILSGRSSPPPPETPAPKPTEKPPVKTLVPSATAQPSPTVRPPTATASVAPATATMAPRRTDTPRPIATLKPTEVPKPPWAIAASPEILQKLSVEDKIKINAALGRQLTTEVKPEEATEWIRINKIASDVLHAVIDPQRIERLDLGLGGPRRIQDYNAISKDNLVKPGSTEPILMIPGYPFPAVKGKDGTIRVLLGDIGGTLFPPEYNAVLAAIPENQKNVFDTSINGATEYSEKPGQPKRMGHITINPGDRGYPTFSSHPTRLQIILVMDPNSGSLKESKVSLQIEPLYYYYVNKNINKMSDQEMLETPSMPFADATIDYYKKAPEQQKRSIIAALQQQMIRPKDQKPSFTPVSEGFTYTTQLGPASVWNNLLFPDIMHIYQQIRT